MEQQVTMKGVKSGIVLKLNSEGEFEDLLPFIREKFVDASTFFGSVKMVLSIEGRELSEEDVKKILDIVAETTKLHIVAVVTEDEKDESRFSKILEEWEEKRDPEEEDFLDIEDVDTGYAEIHIGTLRSGFSYETESSLIILGDVKQGAEVTAGGSVFVFGSLLGIANAGCMGDETAFVVANRLDPLQIRISDLIAISEDRIEEDYTETGIPRGVRPIDHGPEVALISDGHIIIKKYNREFLETTKFMRG